MIWMCRYLARCCPQNTHRNCICVKICYSKKQKCAEEEDGRPGISSTMSVQGGQTSKMSCSCYKIGKPVAFPVWIQLYHTVSLSLSLLLYHSLVLTSRSLLLTPCKKCPINQVILMQLPLANRRAASILRSDRYSVHIGQECLPHLLWECILWFHFVTIRHQPFVILNCIWEILVFPNCCITNQCSFTLSVTLEVRSLGRPSWVSWPFPFPARHFTPRWMDWIPPLCA